MNKGVKILVCGGDPSTLAARVASLRFESDVEIVDMQEAKKLGLSNLTEYLREPLDRVEPLRPKSSFKPPESRRERRAKNRKK